MPAYFGMAARAAAQASGAAVARAYVQRFIRASRFSFAALYAAVERSAVQEEVVIHTQASSYRLKRRPLMCCLKLCPTRLQDL
jgi:hypothetical protein